MPDRPIESELGCTASEPAPPADTEAPSWWDEPPTDAELCGLWPDPFAGPPDGPDAWLADLAAPELDALLAAQGAVTGPKAVGPRAADLADGRVPIAAGFTHRDPGLATGGISAARITAVGSAAVGFAAGGPLDLLAPDPVLAGFTQEVFDAGLGQLSDDELVGALCASRRLSSWQAAMEFAAVSDLDARRKHTSAAAGWLRRNHDRETRSPGMDHSRVGGSLRDLRRTRDPAITARQAVSLDLCPGMDRGAPPGRRARAPCSVEGRRISCRRPFRASRVRVQIRICKSSRSRRSPGHPGARRGSIRHGWPRAARQRFVDGPSRSADSPGAAGRPT